MGDVKSRCDSSRDARKQPVHTPAGGMKGNIGSLLSSDTKARMSTDFKSNASTIWHLRKESEIILRDLLDFFATLRRYLQGHGRE